MKRLLSVFILLSTLFAALPSNAMWYCQAVNDRYENGNCPNCIWYWHAYRWYPAHAGALNACQQSPQTYNPNNCNVSCNPGP